MNNSIKYFIICVLCTSIIYAQQEKLSVVHTISDRKVPTALKKAEEIPEYNIYLRKSCDSKSPEEVNELIELCQNLCGIKLRKGKMLRTSGGFRSLHYGDRAMVTPREAAVLKAKGYVDIEKIKVHALLGLYNTRIASFTVYAGQIQPCQKDVAKQIERAKAGVIITSYADLEKNPLYLKILTPDCFPHMLKRVLICEN